MKYFVYNNNYNITNIKHVQCLNKYKFIRYKYCEKKSLQTPQMHIYAGIGYQTKKRACKHLKCTYMLE